MNDKRPHGVSLIYLIIAFAVISGFISLAVDVGRVQLVKTELRQAADAAARHAAAGVSSGTAGSRAIAAATENHADGTPVVITSADVMTGNWNHRATPKFDTSRFPTNAVCVTALRVAERGNAIPLFFGALVGTRTCDVRAVSIAKADPIINGFIGLDGVTVKNNLVSAGYYSPENLSPDSGSADDPGMIGSNGLITAKNNEQVGQLVLGPNGSHDLSVQSTMRLDSDIPSPPTFNPGGVSTVLNIDGTVVLAGGTYYFTAINLSNNSTLKFAGPATVYVHGNVNFEQNGTITAFEGAPSNLHIRQFGSDSIFGSDASNNQMDFTGMIDAPQTKFSVKNGAIMRGRATFKTMESENNLELYYDHALGATLPGMNRPYSVAIVK